MSSFRLNKKGFGIEVLQSDGMKREMKRRAEKVMARAEATAPVDTGDYKKSFRIVTSVRTVPPYKTKRAVATIGNTVPYAIHVEYGTKNQPRRRVLGKALDAAR